LSAFHAGNVFIGGITWLGRVSETDLVGWQFKGLRCVAVDNQKSVRIEKMQNLRCAYMELAITDLIRPFFCPSASTL
jgi:hypothetical protein